MEFDDILDVALSAARDAAAVHQQHLGKVASDDWSTKGVADFVSDVDHEAEARILERIRHRFPDHRILAEEQAGDEAPDADAEWLWVVDPLDGTTNFLHRYPMYSVSVAAVHRGEIAAGAVIAGATGEEWTAARGRGAYKDGERIRVSEIDDMPRALIGTGFPFRAPDLLPEHLAQLDAVLRRTSGVRRAGSAAIDLCHVATGYFDGFWELVLAPWDIAAGTLIIREAGGLVTRLDGDPDMLGPGTVLAGNPTIYEALRELLGSV